jgi:hypothetical protein
VEEVVVGVANQVAGVVLEWLETARRLEWLETARRLRGCWFRRQGSTNPSVTIVMR